MLWCPIYTEINPLNPKFEPVLVVSTGTQGEPLKIHVCLMQLVSPAEQSPQCWFSSPHYDEASRARRTEEDRWGSLVFAKLHQICQKTTLTQSAVKWLVDPARWHLYLQGRGGHLLVSDQALQHQPLCQSLMGADKKNGIRQKTSQMTARSTTGIWQTRDYLETGTRGPTEPDFTGLTLRFTACSALMTAN